MAKRKSAAGKKEKAKQDPVEEPEEVEEEEEEEEEEDEDEDEDDDSDPFSTDSGGDEEWEVPLDEAESNLPEVGEVYTAVCVDVERNTAKSSGMPKFEFTFRITASEKGKAVECSNWEDRVHCSLSKAALWKLTEVLEAMTVGKAGEKAKFTRDDVLGRMVLISIEANEYNGRVRPKIQGVGVYKNEPGRQIDLATLATAGAEDIPF